MKWILTIVVKAVLEWLTSLLTRLRELEQKKQEGRKEVLDAIDKANKEADEELKRIGSADHTDADLANKLRDGYNRQRKSNVSGG